MHRPHKTKDKYLKRARERWHEVMAAMTPEEKLAHKARVAAYAREWRAKTRDTPEGVARRQRSAARYRDPEKMARAKAIARNSRLVKEYGITQAQFEAMLLEQNGRCFLCHCAPGKRGQLAIDHCHRTGRVRRLLCDSCNVGIAGFERIAEKCGIDRALAYVKDGRTDGVESQVRNVA